MSDSLLVKQLRIQILDLKNELNKASNEYYILQKKYLELKKGLLNDDRKRKEETQSTN